jgi:hypothetical protein
VRPRPRILLWTATSAYAVGFGALSILQYRAYNTGRFDLGNMAQAVWSTADGHPLEVTNLQGEQVSRLGSHVDPILVAFAPLWWIWPSAAMLVAAQAVAIALGALPVFWLARKHLGSEQAALGFALAYLLYPRAVADAERVPPRRARLPAALFAFWYLDEDHQRSRSRSAGRADEGGDPARDRGNGIWYAITRKQWKIGGAIAVLGIVVTAISVQVVLPHFNEGASSGFYQRYGALGHSPGGILATIFTDPGKVLSTVFDREGIRYLVDLFVPLLLLVVVAPVALIAAVPELGLNLLSATDTQSSIHHHYTGGLIPPLVVATVLGAARLTRSRPGLRVPLAMALVVAMVVANFVLGAVPVWRGLPGGQSYRGYASHVATHDRITDRALRMIPDGVVVSATNSLGSHLSGRRRFLSFPYIRDAQWIAADETQPGYADRWDPEATAEALARLRRNPSWRLVFSDDGVLIFRRTTRSR